MLSKPVAVTNKFPADYYTKDGDYYTKSINERDHWHGLLSQEIGLDGKHVTQESYAAQQEALKEIRGKNKRDEGKEATPPDGKEEQPQKEKETTLGYDLCFSAPKSVSLACVHDEVTKAAILESMDEAIANTMKIIEDEYTFAQVQENGIRQTVKTGNLSYADFHHQFSRANDPDEHIHCYIQNATMYKGKMYALNFSKVYQNYMELGFEFRRELMHSLQERGFDCVVTDTSKGLFELVGFDRNIIEKYSKREQEILAKAEELGITSYAGKKELALTTRKNKVAIDVDKKYEEIRNEEFVKNGYKVYRHGKEVDFDGREKDGLTIADAAERDRKYYASLAEEPRITDSRMVSGSPQHGQERAESFKESIEQSSGGRSLSDLPQRGLATAPQGTDLFLQGGTVSNMAKLQADRARSNVMLRQTREGNRARRTAIKNAAKPVIEQAFKESFAHKIPDIRKRIQHELMAYNVTRDEAERAMKDNHLIELGQMKTDSGQSLDRYVTTEKNIQIEHDIIERMKAGKNVLSKERSLDLEKADQTLQAILDKKNEGKAEKDKIVPTADQKEVLLHILSNKDRFLGVQGLAGTGKTFSMTLLRECCEAQNIKIYGASLGNAAKNGLQRESGIESYTIHKLMNDLEKGKFTGLKENTKPVSEIAKELAVESKLISKKDLPSPKRQGWDAIKRSFKEAAADLLPPDQKREYKRQLQAEDIALYKAQQKAEERKEQSQAAAIGAGKDNPKQAIKQEWNLDNVKPFEEAPLLVVDESGFIDDHLMNQLQQAAEKLNFQVAFVGDWQQLPPVGAGNPFRDLQESGMATAHLTNIRRQNDKELLEAVRASIGINADGTGKADYKNTYKILDEREAYHEISDYKERHEKVKEQYCQTPLKDITYEKNGETKMSVMLVCSTNRERRDYNEAIRAEYVRTGQLDEGQAVTVSVQQRDGNWTEETRKLAAGDRIIFTESDHNLYKVDNSEQATVKEVNGSHIIVETDAGKTVDVDTNVFNSFDYGYAITNYKSQGATVDHVIADMMTHGGKPSARNDIYVDISRAKESATVYTDDKDKLEKDTATFARKINSKDFQDKINALRENGITDKDIYQDVHKTLEQELEAVAKRTAEPTTERQEAMSRQSRDLKEAVSLMKEAAQEPSKVLEAAEARRQQEQQPKQEQERTEPAREMTPAERQATAEIYQEITGELPPSISYDEAPDGAGQAAPPVRVPEQTRHREAQPEQATEQEQAPAAVAHQEEPRRTPQMESSTVKDRSADPSAAREKQKRQDQLKEATARMKAPSKVNDISKDVKNMESYTAKKAAEIAAARAAKQKATEKVVHTHEHEEVRDYGCGR